MAPGVAAKELSVLGCRPTEEEDLSLAVTELLTPDLRVSRSTSASGKVPPT
ncbi:hypothetical protein GCM10025871_15810 [Deinococcus metallilatus]|nr:hypothetical protein GCM10025871_15810 [Deinococcus metallilatus]